MKTIAMPPVLSRLKPGVPSLLYLSVADKVVSLTFVQEDGKHQLPIYFTNRILHDAKKWYQMIEKVVLELITLEWRLRPYFQSHQVVVKTNYPIKKVLWKPKLEEMMVAWSIELLELDLQFDPRGPMKTQFMIDFLAEFAANTQTIPN